ncbi:hypothetical protein Trydic_g15191 [Trypoxylus dichotomus]
MANLPSLTYEQIEIAANFVMSCIPRKPKVGIICGRKLSGLADYLQDKIDIPYEKIPDYPLHIPPDPTCIVTYGTCEDIPMLCFRCRFHLNEGYTPDNVVLPIKMLKILGARLVLLTNAANALNPDYSIGDVMIIKDHINLVGFSGNNTLKSNDPRWGSTQLPVNYNKQLRAKAMKIFNSFPFQGDVHEGVFVCAGGSKFQTVAEARLLKTLGGDAVGASIVHEALAAAQCDIDVLAVSVIFGVSATDYDQEAKEKDIEATKTLQPFVSLYIKEVAPELKLGAPSRDYVSEPSPPEGSEESPPETSEQESSPTAGGETSNAEMQAPEIEEKTSQGTQSETGTTSQAEATGEVPAKSSAPTPPVSSATEGEEAPKKKKKYCECKGRKPEVTPKTTEETSRATSTTEKPTGGDEQEKKKICECKHKAQQT